MAGDTIPFSLRAKQPTEVRRMPPTTPIREEGHLKTPDLAKRFHVSLVTIQGWIRGIEVDVKGVRINTKRRARVPIYRGKCGHVPGGLQSGE
jgi:hypothetical protein